MTDVSWNDWYKTTALMLLLHYRSNDDNNSNGNDSQDQSLCDFYRPSLFWPSKTYENRFIKLKDGEISLVYLQNFIDNFQMNEAYPPFSSYGVTTNDAKQGSVARGPYL